ncbi:MAG: AlpA family phage regulatory protein [Betaproteobacteria bacterium]
MRLPAILAVFPVSKTTWYAGMAEGRYPQSVKISGKATAWRAEDIRGLIERTGSSRARPAAAPQAAP